MGTQVFFGPLKVLHYLFSTDKHVPAVTLVDEDGAAGGAAVVGGVGQPSDVIDVTLSTDTNSYADGDVLAYLQDTWKT